MPVPVTQPVESMSLRDTVSALIVSPVAMPLSTGLVPIGAPGITVDGDRTDSSRTPA